MNPATQRKKKSESSFGAGGQGVELGTDQRGWRVRGPLPPIWAGEAAVRRDLAFAGYREGPVSAVGRNREHQMSIPKMSPGSAQAPATNAVTVTADNFIRAETDL
jgi:hypothetical protein